MPFYRTMFFLVIHLFIPQALWAQESNDSLVLPIESITVDDGLSQGMVRSILQTKDGLMWFATKDGLNKYDGYRFTVYRNIAGDSLSLPENYVTRLEEDPQGHIVLATATKGMFVYDQRTEEFIPIQINFPSKTVMSDINFMKIRKEGMLLASAGDLYFFDSLEIRKIVPSNQPIILKPTFHYQYPNSLLYNRSNDYFEGHITWMEDRSIWICFPDKAIIFRPEDIANKKAPFELDWPAGKNIRSINHYVAAADVKRSELVFVYSDAWFGLYNPGSGRFEFQYPRPKTLNISPYLVPLANGNFVIDGGKEPIVFNPYTRSIAYLKKNEWLEKINNYATYTDLNDIVWLGTTGYGILKINTGKASFETLKGKGMRMFRNTANEGLFARGSIMLRYNQSKKQLEEMLPSSFYRRNNFETAFFTSPGDGVYWIKGRKNGEPRKRVLLKYDMPAKRCQQFNVLNQYPKMFELIFIDSRKKVWIIFMDEDRYWKLRQFDEYRDRIISEYAFPFANHYREYDFVSDWWEDRKHRFWFGTTGGLFCFDEQKNQWRHFKSDPTNKNTLSGDMIFSLCPDPDRPEKYVWIGTNGHGLNRFDIQNGTCYRVNNLRTPANKIIYGILSDNAHHLWLSTNNGLICVDVRDFSTQSYTEKDGIAGNEFNRYEYQQLQDGRLLFGGIKGYTLFDPARVLNDTIRTKTMLTGLQVFNQPIDWKQHPSILNAPVQFAKTITLKYNQNMFTIEFASLEYRDASKKYYTYYLDGFNQGWIANGTQHAATFTNLDPGTYTFYVAACDENGKHLSSSASIQLVILTPWWRSWWFMGILLFCIVSMIYALYRYRLHQATKILLLRNRIAGDLHDEIGSTISSISLTSSLLQKKMQQDDPVVKSLLQRISNNSSDILEGMSDIVWAINAENDRFTYVFNRMRAFAVEVLEPKNIQLEFTVDESLHDLKLDIMQRKNLYLLYKEAIHNISKYASAHTVKVVIEKMGPSRIKMRIEDDGIGFDLHTINAQTLGGNGLINMQNRAEQMNGLLTITSEPGKGSCITLVCSV